MGLSQEERIKRKEHRKLSKWNKEHKIIDGIDYKLCSICNHWMIADLEHFYRNEKNGLDGLYPYCKECSIKKADKRQKNPVNQESVRKSARKRNAKPDFKVKMREYAKRQREDGYQKEYQENNREKFREYSKNRQNKNHQISKSEWKQCKQYFDYSCAYCGMTEKDSKKIYNEKLHKEHVIHDGLNDLSNCIPACKSCNSQKWEFSFDDWYNEDNEKYDFNRLNKIINWLQKDYRNYIEIM